MAKRVPVFEETLANLFPVDEASPCSTGSALLRDFAARRESDFSFLKPSDLEDPTNTAFDGIPEWDAFVQHYRSCESCNG